ncbi:MAG TPA: hypothetical protein VGV38_21905, partial [Pyrinomonadaceae bacterium]|nr:hypothetical protein [Pyrinomonadaceae bacterium]
VKSAQVGRGRFLLGDDLTRLLAFARVRREPMAEQNLRFTRRRHAGGGLYFILNRGEQPVDGWVTLQTGARSAAVFDAMTGESGLAPIRTAADGAAEVYLQLAPGESRVVKTFGGAVRGPAYEYFRLAGEPVLLNGEWSVRFVEGGPELPPARRANGLEPWTNFDGDAYKRFSGTAVYTHTFEGPRARATDYVLHLGRVAESARVRLNGTDLGTHIVAPFRVRVPASLLRDRNTLEVTVSNLMANRIIDMERRGVRWKKFYNTNFPARRPENRGADGLFDASKWSPRDSGLLGPVTLAPVERISF